MFMKKILILLSVVAAIPAYGMDKESSKKKYREPLENPDHVKRVWLIIINNTFKDHTVRIGRHKHHVKFMNYKRIKTSANSINVDRKRDYKLDPTKKFFYLGTPLEDHAALYHPPLPE